MMILINYAMSMLPFMMAAMAVTVTVRFIIYRKTRVFNRKREIVILLFFAIMAGLFSQTLIPPEIMKGNFADNPYHLPLKEQIILNPYSLLHWIYLSVCFKDINGFLVNYIGNIVLFLPVGLCLPYLWKCSAKRTVLSGFFISFFIEFCQLFYNRTSDIGDIILNTLGAALGYLIYKKLSSSK